MKLNAQQRREVTATAVLDLRTLRAWERGEPIREASRIRIERALAQLGIKDASGSELVTRAANPSEAA